MRGGAAGGCLIAVALASVMNGPALATSDPPFPASAKQESSQPQTQTPGSGQRPTNEIRGTEQSPLVVKTAPSEDAKAKAEEDAKERQNKAASDWWLIALTAMLAIATIALVLVTGGLVWFAWRQARDMKEAIEAARTSAIAADVSNKITREIYVATERPWLSLGATLSSDLTWCDYDARLSVDFEIVNIGKSPATNIYMIAEIHVRPIGATNLDLWEDLILRVNEHKYEGEIIFPRGNLKSTWNFDITEKSIARVLVKEGMDNIGIHPWILACVSYQFTEESERTHYTAIRLSLVRRSGDHATSIMPDRKPVARADLELSRPNRMCIRAT